VIRVRNKAEAYEAWDKRSVVIRIHDDGSTTVYPSLGKGVMYYGFSLRDEYVLARLADLQKAVHYCDHHYYLWNVIGRRS
jgi:hypothetical protein